MMSSKSGSNFYRKMGTAIAALDGWPLCSLDEFDVQIVSMDQFRSLLSEGAGTGRVFASRISDETSTEVIFAGQSFQSDEAYQEVLSSLLRHRSFKFPPNWLILIDQPCFVFPKGGAVAFRDGRILSDTIYPSTGGYSMERQIGESGLDRNKLSELLANALQWSSSKIPMPICSRWSSVYSHAIVESCVQDSMITQLSLPNAISYVVPAEPQGCQSLLLNVAKQNGIEQHSCSNSVVAVPRLLLCSLIYDFGVYGTEWRRFAESMRELARARHPMAQSPRVYVSRLGASARPMRNEPELIAELCKRGFKVFDERGQTFSEQVAAFGGATLVVGPHGSGLLNAGFAPPGCRLIELRPLNRPPSEVPMVDNFVLRVCAGSKLLYYPHISRNSTITDEWYADIPDILHLIDHSLPTSV